MQAVVRNSFFPLLPLYLDYYNFISSLEILIVFKIHQSYLQWVSDDYGVIITQYDLNGSGFELGHLASDQCLSCYSLIIFSIRVIRIDAMLHLGHCYRSVCCYCWFNEIPRLFIRSLICLIGNQRLRNKILNTLINKKKIKVKFGAYNTHSYYLSIKKRKNCFINCFK